MKRYIRSNYEPDAINYAVRVNIELNVVESEYKVAAAKYIKHPTQVQKSTFFFTEEALNRYDDIVATLISNTLNEGMVLTNFGDKSFQSIDSYTVYPRFKVKGNPRADRFTLIIRAFDHNRNQDVPEEFKGTHYFETIDLFASCTVVQVGTEKGRPLYDITSIDTNIINLAETVQSYCGDFKEWVASRIDKTDTLVEWSERFSKETGYRFSLREKKDSNHVYIFYVYDDGDSEQFKERDLIHIESYEEFYEFISGNIG